MNVAEAVRDAEILSAIKPATLTEKNISLTLDHTQTVTVPLDPNVCSMRVGLSTDGSGAVQKVVLPNLPADADGNQDQWDGYRVRFVVDHKLDGVK